MTDKEYLLKAIELAFLCPESNTAYAVGCVLVTEDKRVYTGYSRELSTIIHAEEVAISKACMDNAILLNSKIFISMEPCSSRKSSPQSCSDLIIKYGISKVVFATKEPDLFVKCEGRNILMNAGVEVIHLEEFSNLAIKPFERLFNNLKNKY